MGKILLKFEGNLIGSTFHIYGELLFGARIGVDVTPVKRDVAIMLNSTINVRIILLQNEGGNSLHVLKKVTDTGMKSVNRHGQLSRSDRLEEKLREMLDVSTSPEMKIEMLDGDLLWVDSEESGAALAAFNGMPYLCLGNNHFKLLVRKDGNDTDFNSSLHLKILEEAIPTILMLREHISHQEFQAWHIFCLPSGNALGLFPRIM